MRAQYYSLELLMAATLILLIFFSIPSFEIPKLPNYGVPQKIRGVCSGRDEILRFCLVEGGMRK